MENLWKAPGEHLEIMEHQEKHRTSGKHLENIQRNVEHLEKTWKAPGEHLEIMEDTWRTPRRKDVENEAEKNEHQDKCREHLGNNTWRKPGKHLENTSKAGGTAGGHTENVS